MYTVIQTHTEIIYIYIYYMNSLSEEQPHDSISWRLQDLDPNIQLSTLNVRSFSIENSENSGMERFSAWPEAEDRRTCDA